MADSGVLAGSLEWSGRCEIRHEKGESDLDEDVSFDG